MSSDILLQIRSRHPLHHITSLAWEHISSRRDSSAVAARLRSPGLQASRDPDLPSPARWTPTPIAPSPHCLRWLSFRFSCFFASTLALRNGNNLSAWALAKASPLYGTLRTSALIDGFRPLLSRDHLPRTRGAAPVSLNNPCLKELTLAPRVRNPAAAHPSLYHLHYAAKDPGIFYARSDPRSR